MGFTLSTGDMDSVCSKLLQNYRLYAPVLKTGEGRFTDTDVVRYDFANSFSEIEFDKKSDYSFKEILTPLSKTLFFFTEKQVKEADEDERQVIVFLRSCDIHALKRLDQIYLDNGPEDYFYKKIRNRLHFALIGCKKTFDDCFCVSMGTNKCDEYMFSVDKDGDTVSVDIKDTSVEEAFAGVNAVKADITPAYVTENKVKVTRPTEVPLSVFKSEMWNEYNTRCLACGRCNFVCPTCTCFTMQDVYYTDNGKVGERRRVAASCMVDGFTNVAGGGQYRKTYGERMRFKTMHKIYDFRKRFGYDMCVGCGRCDMVCPEYISFSTIINKVNDTVNAENGKGDM